MEAEPSETSPGAIGAAVRYGELLKETAHAAHP